MFIVKNNPSSIGDYKREAKAKLSGNWIQAILLVLMPLIIWAIVIWIVALIPFLAPFVNIVNYFFITGVTFTLLTLVSSRNYSISPFSDVLQIFTRYSVIDFLVLVVLKYIFITLWGLLFIIPGIIKRYSYSMSEYIIKDYNDRGESISATEAITLSRQLMDGHKLELFFLELSFIGWWIVTFFTAGLGWLYTEPYYRTTHAVFYRSLTQNQLVGIEGPVQEEIVVEETIEDDDDEFDLDKELDF